VHSASSSREERSPLNFAARFGLYAMLVGLVLASFLVKPEGTASKPTGPVASASPEPARAELTARRAARPPRDVDRGQAAALPSLGPSDDQDNLVAGATGEPVAEPAAESEPAAEPEPRPEPTPPPPPPRPPAPRGLAPITDATTASGEARMLELMNASRARAGLAPLTVDAAVAAAARAHSGVEAQVRYVYHDGPDGTARSRDLPACGTGWYGENTGKIWNGNVDALHIEFMAEPWEPINHRTNIMDSAFRRVGVGAVIGPDAMYMTMVFCR
jgi:uncharacterized protein YkwD